MRNQKDDLNEVLQELHAVALPGNLADCFEFHREHLLQDVCTRYTENRLSWLLLEINLFRGASPVNSFNDAFDPFLGLPNTTDLLPIGTRIVLPELPSAAFELGTDDPLNDLISFAVTRLYERLDAYDDEEIWTLGELAAAGFVDSRIPQTREGIVQFVAANTSREVQEFLKEHPSRVARRVIEILT